MGIHIIIVDDHRLFLEGLKFILQQNPDVQILDEVADARSLLSVLQTKSADVILMDINMPGLNGIEATQRVKQEHPHCKIIAVTMLDDYSSIRQMMRAGADGYLLKNAAPDEIFLAIESVLAHESYYSPEVRQVLLNKALGEEKKGNTRAASHPEEQLTRREWEILRLITDGLTNPEIAERLFISESTAITHRKNILHKFSQKNTASLVRYVLDNRLFDHK